MRKVKFANDEYYHVYNRGVDKRVIYQDKEDYQRFLDSLDLFNSDLSFGSLRDHRIAISRNRVSGEGPLGLESERLVDVVSYCLNPNHYHLILCQKKDGGISDFMKRVAGGYTKYFNDKHDRSGSLFQGPFKAAHISDDSYLMHLAVYVTLNNHVHNYSKKQLTLTRTSLDEYYGNTKEQICSNFDLITRGISSKEEFLRRTGGTLQQIQRRKEEDREWRKACID